MIYQYQIIFSQYILNHFHNHMIKVIGILLKIARYTTYVGNVISIVFPSYWLCTLGHLRWGSDESYLSEEGVYCVE